MPKIAPIHHASSFVKFMHIYNNDFYIWNLPLTIGHTLYITIIKELSGSLDMLVPT